MIHARLILSTRDGVEEKQREDTHIGAIYAWATTHVLDAGHKVTEVTHTVSADTGGTTTTFWSGTLAAAARLFHNNP